MTVAGEPLTITGARPPRALDRCWDERLSGGRLAASHVNRLVFARGVLAGSGWFRRRLGSAAACRRWLRRDYARSSWKSAMAPFVPQLMGGTGNRVAWSAGR